MAGSNKPGAERAPNRGSNTILLNTSLETHYFSMLHNSNSSFIAFTTHWSGSPILIQLFKHSRAFVLAASNVYMLYCNWVIVQNWAQKEMDSYLLEVLWRQLKYILNMLHNFYCFPSQSVSNFFPKRDAGKELLKSFAFNVKERLYLIISDMTAESSSSGNSIRISDTVPPLR